MTQALTLEPRARVLEIGTGSGYQTAVLSRLARLVYTVERYRTLLREAEARFRDAASSTNIITKFGDGGAGLAGAGAVRPHSGHSGGAGRAEDVAVAAQAVGVLVAPIGKRPVQKLSRYAGDGAGGFKEEVLCEVRFVPLLDGVAREL